MAELADAPDLGSGGNPVQVRPLLSAPNIGKPYKSTFFGLSGFLFIARPSKRLFSNDFT